MGMQVGSEPEFVMLESSPIFCEITEESTPLFYSFAQSKGVLPYLSVAASSYPNPVLRILFRISTFSNEPKGTGFTTQNIAFLPS